MDSQRERDCRRVKINFELAPAEAARLGETPATRNIF